VRRGWLELITVSVIGAALFVWPLVAGDQAPVAISVSVLCALIATVAVVEAAARRLDARRLALLATIAAIDAALRLVLVIGLGGFSPIFFLILVAGYAYGPSFGFLCGATSLLTSAVVTGGLGPWLPYEALGCAWVGAAAGIAGLRRSGPVAGRDIVVLAVVGVVSGFLYGALLDTWDWTTFYRGVPEFGWQPGLSAAELLRRFGVFYLATSIWYDAFRAVGNAVAVVVLGFPVLAAFARMRSRFSVSIQADAAAV
jgi:energy-coupling factor transport system substrate-specific component